MKRGLIIQAMLGILLSLTTAGMAQEREENRDYQYVLIEAVKQKNLGQLAEAVKLYNLVIKDKPDCAVAHYEVGTIYLMTNQFEFSRKNLEQAYRLDPDNKWYTLAYLNSLGALEEYDKAAEILKEQIEQNPGLVEWEYQLATVYFSMGKSGKAIRLLERIEKEHGFSEKITLLKASVYESEEKYDLAREEISKVMLLFPEAIQFRVVAAELCMKSGDEEEAAVYYKQILEVDSTNIFALTNLTDYYRKEGDMKQSLNYLAKSFESNQIDIKRKMAILSYYLSEEDFITTYPLELGAVLEAFTGAHPQEEEVRLIATDFFIQTQDYKKAYEHLEFYLQDHKGTYNIYMQSVLLANAASLREEMIEMCDQALLVYPDSADLRFFRGLGYYETDAFEQVIANFSGVQTDSYSRGEYASQASMLVAEAYYRIEDYIRSDSLFEVLIQDEPENYTVLNNYSYYLAERGEKLDQALQWSRLVVSKNPENATFLDTYAWVLFKSSSYEEAEKIILKALDKGGANDPEVNEHAGDIQAALQSIEIARSYYLKAILVGGEKERIEVKIDQLKSGRDE